MEVTDLETRQTQIIELIKRMIQPAVGCTEPAAVAYATALAVRTLGRMPDDIHAAVSRNILKNAMGVGIPGTDMIGLPIAVALGAVCGDADAGLAVLHDVNEDDVEIAKKMLDDHRIHISLAEGSELLYINVQVSGGGHTCTAVISGSHTNVRYIERDGLRVAAGAEGQTQQDQIDEIANSLSLTDIDQFVRDVDWKRLLFLRDCITINKAISDEGMRKEWGLSIGRSMLSGSDVTNLSEEGYATAVTCSAADARMAGCTLPVMTSCGSGNQGLTATLPVIALCEKRGEPEDVLLRALAYSLLVTIHVKQHIGHLSALCACSVGASIGTAAAIVYLDGGDLSVVDDCICNVISDVSGVICDGAKTSCSMKVATGISSAFRSAMLAERHHRVTFNDGIVGRTAEATIDNLGNLCNRGMEVTDKVILDILVDK